MMADGLVTLGILLAGVAIIFTGAAWLDPVISLAVVGVVLWSIWGLFRDAMRLSLNVVPDGVDLEAVRSYLRNLPGVSNVHDLHIWAMSTTETALTTHVVVPGHTGNSNPFLQKACQGLHNKFEIVHTTLQIKSGEPCRPLRADVAAGGVGRNQDNRWSSFPLRPTGLLPRLRRIGVRLALTSRVPKHRGQPVLPSGDNAYGYVGRAFKALVGAYALVVLHLAFANGAPILLEVWSPPWPWAVSVTGWLLLAVSLVWLLVAQIQMGAPWRVGIDSERRTDLVQHGLFSVSRNSIFLAMRLNLLGLLLVFPAAATLVLPVAGEILMQVQVRREEQHLTALHGEAYRAYRSHVRRWL